MAAQYEPNFALFTSWNGGVINPLFDGLTYTVIQADILLIATQLAKYLRVLYVKPSNKVYIFTEPEENNCFTQVIIRATAFSFILFVFLQNCQEIGWW